jgi:hypothetical protein
MWMRVRNVIFRRYIACRTHIAHIEKSSEPMLKDEKQLKSWQKVDKSETVEFKYRFLESHLKFLPQKYTELSEKYYEWALKSNLPAALKEFYELRMIKDRYYTFLYRPLLQYCSWYHEPELAFELFNGMKSDNVKLIPYDYFNLIRSCASHGAREVLLPRAFELAAEMEKKGLYRNIGIHMMLLLVVIRHGKEPTVIESLLDDLMILMKTDKIEFDGKLLITLLRYYQDTRRAIEDIRVRLEKIERSGFLMDGSFYHTLYMFLTSENQTIDGSKLALSLYEQQKKKSVPMLHVDTYFLILKAAHKCRNYELGLAIYEKFEPKYININTINLFMDLCLTAHQYSRIYQAYESMKLYKLWPTLRTFDTVFEACNRDDRWDRAAEIEEENENYFKIPLGYRALLSLVSCAARSRSYADVIRLKQKISESHIKLPVPIQKILQFVEDEFKPVDVL